MLLAATVVDVLCGDGDRAGDELRRVGGDLAGRTIPMGIAGEFDSRFVDVPTRAPARRLVTTTLVSVTSNAGASGADVGGDFARAVDLPVAGCEPRPGAC